MTKYDVTDETLIASTPEQVYNTVIACYDGKKDWWLPNLSSKIIHGNSCAVVGGVCKVTLHEVVPIQFITKVVEVIPNEKLRVIYPKGAFIGEGVWMFQKEGEKTRLSFRWQTNPSGFFIKMISLLYPLNKAHSAVMQKGFKNLKKLLEKN